MRTPYPNELMHYGVMGMKWGIRRYQNPDGTLTAAGRKRYGYDLDINDKSRTNIARIRKGEALRRLDVARSNNETNATRIADLQGRVRSAKKAEKMARRIDKGTKRAAKGETITANRFKGGLAYVAAHAGSAAWTSFLNSRMSSLSSQGRWTAGHQAVAEGLNKYGSYALHGLATAYNVKKTVDNYNIRAYQSARLSGQNTIKSVGSQEYADRVKQTSKK